MSDTIHVLKPNAVRPGPRPELPRIVRVRRTVIGAASPARPFFAATSVIAAAATLAIAWSGLPVAALPFGTATLRDPLILAAALAALYAILAGERIRLPNLPIWLLFPAGMLVVTASLSGLVPYSPHVISPREETGLTGLIKLEVAMVLFPVLLSVVAASPRRVLLFTKFWLVSATVSALVALSDYVGLTTIGQSLIGSGAGGRVSGLAIHSNQLGLSCAMVIPIALFLVSRTRVTTTAVAYSALAAINLFAVLASGSRAAVVGAGIALAYMLITSPPVRRHAVVLAAVGGSVLLLALGASQVKGAETALDRLQPSSVSAQTSDAERAVLYEEATDGFEDRPVVGTGFGAIKGAHSLYLQILEVGGLLALLAAVVFSVGFARSALRLVKCARCEARRQLALALLGSFGVLLVVGIGGNNSTGREVFVPVGLLLALAMIERPVRKVTSRPSTVYADAGAPQDPRWAVPANTDAGFP